MHKYDNDFMYLIIAGLYAFVCGVVPWGVYEWFRKYREAKAQAQAQAQAQALEEDIYDIDKDLQKASIDLYNAEGAYEKTWLVVKKKEENPPKKTSAKAKWHRELGENKAKMEMAKANLDKASALHRELSVKLDLARQKRPHALTEQSGPFRNVTSQLPNAKRSKNGGSRRKSNAQKKTRVSWKKNTQSKTQKNNPLLKRCNLRL